MNNGEILLLKNVSKQKDLIDIKSLKHKNITVVLVERNYCNEI